MADAVVRYGNAGRGDQVIAQRTSELVYHARETVAEFFDAKVENTIFTLNCTHALNVAIQGILKSGEAPATVKETMGTYATSGCR